MRRLLNRRGKGCFDCRRRDYVCRLLYFGLQRLGVQLLIGDIGARHLVPERRSVRFCSAHVGKSAAARSWNPFLVFDSLGLLAGCFLRGFLCLQESAVSLRSAFERILFRARPGPGRTPVADAVPPRESKSKADRQPLLSRTEAEGSGEVERNHHHAHDHDGSARKVEVMDQGIDHQAAGQTFHGQGMHPAEMARDEAEEGGREDQVEKNAGHFRSGGSGRAGSQPRPPQHTEQQGDHESGDSLHLQQHVTEESANQPSPVVCLPAHGVEGRVGWTIGGQGEEEEARGHQQHHAGYFIQPTVARRGQCQFKWLHQGYAVAAANSERQSGFIIPEMGRGKPKTEQRTRAGNRFRDYLKNSRSLHSATLRSG